MNAGPTLREDYGMNESEELIQLRTVAMLAQAAVDAFEKGRNTVALEEVIEDLREALTRIGKQASSSCVQKDFRNEPPEAGENPAGSPS